MYFIVITKYIQISHTIPWCNIAFDTSFCNVFFYIKKVEIGQLGKSPTSISMIRAIKHFCLDECFVFYTNIPKNQAMNYLKNVNQSLCICLLLYPVRAFQIKCMSVSCSVIKATQIANRFSCLQQQTSQIHSAGHPVLPSRHPPIFMPIFLVSSIYF